ncbi:MAG: acyl--CoA ligase [Proteobacteria bacterium]|nr:acyl--CoA ligase [Pseudomonadota bacterium]
MFSSKEKKVPWSTEYSVFGIPKTFKPYPDKPAFDILDTAAKKFKKTGAIQYNFKMTYPQLKDHADRLAAAFASMGLKKGDRVATLLPTSIQFIITDYAISKAGLVHVPCSSLEPIKILSHKFDESKPQALVCLDTNGDVAEKLSKKCRVPQVILTNILDYSNTKPESHEKLTLPGASWMTELIASNKPCPPDITFNVKEDLELLLFTGGTTGLPKGCMLTHQNIYANTIQSGWAFGNSKNLLTGAISVLLGLPFFHSYGHVVMHSMTMQGFNMVLVPDGRDTSSMVQMIKTYRPLMQIGVPAQFMQLSKEGIKGHAMLGVSGSAPLPPSTQKEFEKKSGGAIMEGYGLSEMAPCTHLNPSLLLRISGGRFQQRIMSFVYKIPGVAFITNRFLRFVGPKIIGYVVCKGLALILFLTSKDASKKKSNEKRGTSGFPFPDTDVKLLDVKTGDTLGINETLKPGMVGELCLKGPQRMLGYWPHVGSGCDDQGYIHTGDVVMIDDNGYFYIVDRTKDMINVSGYKVYSREIDDILYGHPAIEHAATVGIPDADREGSERVVIYVQPKAEFKDSINGEEFIEFLSTRVAKYAVPKKVMIIDQMPLTEVQKLNKKVVREMAIKQFGFVKSSKAS